MCGYNCCLDSTPAFVALKSWSSRTHNRKKMSRTALILCLLLLNALLFPHPLLAAETNNSIADPPVSSRFLVRADDPLAAEALDGRPGLRVVMSLPQINAVVLEMDAEIAAGHSFAAAETGNALYADVVTLPTAELNDPMLAGGGQWAPQRIQAPEAWKQSDGRDVIVAVVDSGVDLNHPELRDRLVPGYNFWEDNDTPADRCGHGTHVAGIVAASANNGEGIAGISYGAKLMPVKVMADECYGTYSRLIAGILYAVDAGARVVVITSGAYIYSPMLHDAVRYAHDQGALVIAAAGNDGTDRPFYPAAFDEVVAVAGADQFDGSYYRTNHGPHIDIAAPAVEIISSYWANGQSTYAILSGTSMAAPHVAGTAALALALDPELPLADLVEFLYTGADDRGDPGKDTYYGHGRANAWRTVYNTLMAVGTDMETLYLPALLGGR